MKSLSLTALGIVVFACSADQALARGGRGSGGGHSGGSHGARSSARSSSGSHGGPVHVKGYTKNDGTAVHAHDRAAPGHDVAPKSGVAPYRPGARTTYRGSSTTPRAKGSPEVGEDDPSPAETQTLLAAPDGATVADRTNVSAVQPATNTGPGSAANAMPMESDETKANRMFEGILQLNEKARQQLRSGETEIAKRLFDLVKRRVKELKRLHPRSSAATKADEVLAGIE